eukprot:768102-Hanusia_phi.AAC.4
MKESERRFLLAIPSSSDPSTSAAAQVRGRQNPCREEQLGRVPQRRAWGDPVSGEGRTGLGVIRACRAVQNLFSPAMVKVDAIDAEKDLSVRLKSSCAAAESRNRRSSEKARQATRECGRWQVAAYQSSLGSPRTRRALTVEPVDCFD